MPNENNFEFTKNRLTIQNIYLQKIYKYSASLGLNPSWEKE